VKKVFTLFLFVYCFSVCAQEAYRITGYVFNQENNEPLFGAILFDLNTNNSASTNFNGRFQITGVTNDTAQIVCTILGFESDTITVTKANRDNLKIYLKESSEMLETVVITGIAEGQIKAFLDQKKAENIKNIVSAEQIKTFPDMNAAEVMQRIPGITLQRDQGEGRYVQLRGTPPELTTFNVNGEQIPSPEGNVRYVGMDVIASDQIEFIEVNKVLTPDMDGDGIAGSVNIKTKKASSQEGDFQSTLSGGYSDLRSTPNYQGQFSYGQRKKKLGFQINGSYFRNEQGSDNIEYDYVKGPFFGSQDEGRDNYFVQFNEIQLRHYNITRTRVALSPTLDYQFNEHSKIYLQGMFNQFTDYEIRRRKIYTLDDALHENYYLYGGINHDVRERTKIQELSSLSLGGEHKIWKLNIDYQVFYAIASEEIPDLMEINYDNPGQAIGMRIDRTDPDYPKIIYPDTANARYANDYENYEMDNLLFSKGETRDINVTPRINIEIPTSFGKHWKGYFKTGGKMRWKSKARDIQANELASYRTTSFVYPGEGPPMTIPSLSDGFSDNNLLNQGYIVDNLPGSDEVRRFYEEFPQFFIIDRLGTREQSFGEDYNAKEVIYATYAMFRQDYKKLMILGGVRFEETHIQYQGQRIVSDGNRFLYMDTLTDSRVHSFLLPQLQLKYSVNNNLNIRAAYTESYARPNFEYVLPYRQEQDRNEIRYGNPNLIYPKANNFDILIEKYLKKGILSGGVFFKNIKDFIFQYKRFGYEGDPSNFSLVELTAPVNGIRAHVYGAELQAQFMFDFLPGIWKRFGWFSNYTFTHSEALIQQRTPANYSNQVVLFGDNDFNIQSSEEGIEVIQLPGQAQHTANLAIFYDYKKIFIRVTGNYQDDFLNELGADKDLDIYYDENFRLDLTANYQVNKKIQCFVNAMNLTNAPLRRYIGEKSRAQQLEYYSWWIRGGVRIKY
jgi:TonB-dependent receptor